MIKFQFTFLSKFSSIYPLPIVLIFLLTSHPLLSIKSNAMPSIPKVPHGKTKKAQQVAFAGKIKNLKNEHGELLTVPPQAPSTLRIASYNVHDWRGPEVDLNSPIKNFENQYRVIENINAGLIILQEVDNSEKKIKRFKKLGYKHKVFVGATHEKSNFGNMILSKLPLKHIVKRNFKKIIIDNHSIWHTRAFIKVELDLSCYGKKNLVIYGTHFAVESNELRFAEAQELIELIEKYDHDKNVIIGADFNATRNDKPVQYLENRGFVNSFVRANIEPGFTHWSGKVIDFLYGKYIDLSTNGSFIYYDGASDHLPIITDINI